MAGALVQRSGAGAGTGEGRIARPPSSGAVTRRRSAAGSKAATRSYFYTDQTAAIKLSPQAVIVAAISFISVVFVMHILAKLRS